VEQAREEGYPIGMPKSSDAPKHSPFHGYFFKILKAQGTHAPGGKFSYVINGNMIAGYALIAYPDKWGSSGVMTFIASILVGALFVKGFFAAAATTRRVNVVDLGIVLLPTILVIVPLFFHAWADYTRTGQLIGVQGRYLYPGFVGLVAIAAVGVDLLVGLLPPVAERLLPLLACVLALAIEVAAVDIVCTKLWLHNGSLLHGGASKVAHAIGAIGPWPGTVTMAMLALPLVTGLVVLIAAGRETTRRSSESPPLGIFPA